MANLKCVESFSATAASNATTDVPQSDYQDNLNAALFKNKYRGLKASIYSTIADICGFDCITTGTASAYVLAQSRDLDTPIQGLRVAFTPHANCDATPTLAAGDLDAFEIKTQTGAALAADDLVADVTYEAWLETSTSPDEWRLCAPLAADITAEIAAILGTVTDVLTATSNKALTGDALRDSGAMVTITMDNAMELDAEAGRNFKPDATVNTNSTISLANVNTRPGTVLVFTFTIDGTNRTFTFPSGSVTPGGFSTLTKEFTASQTHQAVCFVRESGVYDWAFRLDIKAAT